MIWNPPATDDCGFDEPWQAQAIAIAAALQDAGLISAVEWAQALGRERTSPGLRDDGGDYYHSVVAALETSLASLGISTRAELGDIAQAWQRAALATPHGVPVMLENDPQRRSGRQVAARQGL